MNKIEILNEFVGNSSNVSTSTNVVAINATILILLAIGLPAICVGLLALFKIKINPRNSMYLYAFASGLMILLGTVGLVGESIEHLNRFFEDNKLRFNKIISTIITTTILIGGSIVAMGIVFLTRFLVLKKERIEKGITEDAIELNKIITNELINIDGDSHCDHNDAIYNYRDIQKRDSKLKKSNKSIAIILMVSHRLVDGLSLGVFAPLANGIANFSNWGIIIVFVLHLIPSSMVIFLTQLDLYKSRLKAYLYSLGLLFIFVPFVYIGAFLSYGVPMQAFGTFWIMPLFFTISGIILLLMSILELIPEFIDNRNMTKKQWLITVACLTMGIILALGLLAIHSHPESEHINHHHYIFKN